MNSPLFEPNTRAAIERKVRDLLNQQEDFLSPATSGSARAAGDAIQQIVGEHFEELVDFPITDYRADFSKKALEDLAFRDAFGNYVAVDVKTLRRGTKFNRPNLISVAKLAKFYSDASNLLVLLMVDYQVVGTKVEVKKVTLTPIEHLKWSCLAIGALGQSQIQIKDAKRVEIDPTQKRRSWMIEFCNTVLAFYPREITKIKRRIGKFEKVKEFWLSKPEV
jgi:hypothetical protein